MGLLNSAAEASKRQPAVTAAIAFIVGVMAFGALPPTPEIWCIGSAACAIAGLLAIRAGWLSSVLVILSLFTAGLTGGQVDSFRYPAGGIGDYLTDSPRIARLRVRITDPPRLLASRSAFQKGSRQVTRGEVKAVLNRSGWRDASGTTLVQIARPLERLRAGQTIEALGLLRRPSPAGNPGQFDWAGYYRRERILASFSVSQAGAIRVIGDDPTPALVQLRQSARSLLGRGFAEEASLDHALLRALVLGDSDPELRDVQEQFRRTGTSHHLAISGTHIMLLGIILYFCCRVVGLGPRSATIVGLVGVLLYGTLALPSAPVWRSVILSTAVAVGLLIRRDAEPLNLLALSALALLSFQPLDLFSAGFQLSFLCVLGLIVFTGPIERFLYRPDGDILVAMSVHARVPLLERWKVHLGRWSAAPLATALAAWSMSLPIVAWHFEQLNPWAVFASIILIVPVFLALLGGFAKIILTLLLPLGAAWWAAGASSAIAFMRWCVELLGKLPGSDLPISAPPLVFIIIYYALLALPLIRSPGGRLRRWAPVAPVAAVALLALFTFTSAPNSGGLRLTLLSVGAGQCCVIELPDGRTAMIDAGSSTFAGLDRQSIAPFLRHIAARCIDLLLLTHGDEDHTNAAEEMIANHGVGRVIVGEHFDGERLPSWRTLSSGEAVSLGNGALLESIGPGQDERTVNDNAMVLRLMYAGRTILLPSDIQEAAQRALLERPGELRCDVLIAPHHGSAEPATGEFLRAADPRIILSSNDDSLSRKQVLFDRLAAGRKLHRTNKCGAISVLIERNGNVTVETFRRR